MRHPGGNGSRSNASAFGHFREGTSGGARLPLHCSRLRERANGRIRASVQTQRMKYAGPFVPTGLFLRRHLAPLAPPRTLRDLCGRRRHLCRWGVRAAEKGSSLWRRRVKAPVSDKRRHFGASGQVPAGKAGANNKRRYEKIRKILGGNNMRAGACFLCRILYPIQDGQADIAGVYRTACQSRF